MSKVLSGLTDHLLQSHCKTTRTILLCPYVDKQIPFISCEISKVTKNALDLQFCISLSLNLSIQLTDTYDIRTTCHYLYKSYPLALPNGCSLSKVLHLIHHTDTSSHIFHCYRCNLSPPQVTILTTQQSLQSRSALDLIFRNLPKRQEHTHTPLS